jgi:hypothetical protein
MSRDSQQGPGGPLPAAFQAVRAQGNLRQHGPVFPGPFRRCRLGSAIHSRPVAGQGLESERWLQERTAPEESHRMRDTFGSKQLRFWRGCAGPGRPQPPLHRRRPICCTRGMRAGQGRTLARRPGTGRLASRAVLECPSCYRSGSPGSVLSKPTPSQLPD